MMAVGASRRLRRPVNSPKRKLVSSAPRCGPSCLAELRRDITSSPDPARCIRRALRPPPSCGWLPAAHRPTPPAHRWPARLRPFCRAISCTSLSARSILVAPFCSARAAEAGRDRLSRGGGVFLERHQVGGLGAELDAQVEHEIVDRARLFEVAVHRFLRGAHAVLGDAAVVAGEQHRPFGERHEDRIVHAQLHRQFDLALGRIEAHRVDILLDLAQDGGVFVVVEFGDLEIGRQRDHQHVDLFIRRADRLRVRDCTASAGRDRNGPTRSDRYRPA